MSKWRLINGEELYDIQRDPGQTNDVAGANENVVQSLRASYEEWWVSLKPAMEKTVHVQIGSDAEERTRLTAHDWLTASTPWHQNMIRSGQPKNGPWAVEVAANGRYEIVVSRWPEFTKLPMEAKSIDLLIQGQQLTLELEKDATSARFEVDLKKGETQLKTVLDSDDGKKRGAYYAYIRKI